VRHRQKNEESDVTVIAKPHIMVSICNTWEQDMSQKALQAINISNNIEQN